MSPTTRGRITNDNRITSISETTGEVEMVDVNCPKCGEKISVKGTGGRKPKDLPVIFICDTLRACSSVAQAAEELGCSRGYIYKVLRKTGMMVNEVMETRL
ncbi:hypothetical protein ACFLU8_02875 [Chloroflexota bacterium]